MTEHDLPSGYVVVRSPAGTWLAQRDVAAALERGDADSLLRSAAPPGPATGSGRGAAVRFRLAGTAAFGKTALHGGWLGRLLAGSYLGTARVRTQVVSAARLRAAGITTPEMLAVGWARRAGPLHAHAVITREIPDGRDLLQLARDGPAISIDTILDECARLLRAMHDAGFVHGDLNVGNLVWGRDGVRQCLFVVDLDKGRFVTASTLGHRRRNLARLARSYHKWIAARVQLTRRQRIRFLRRYAGDDRVLFRRLALGLDASRSAPVRLNPPVHSAP